MDILNIGDSIVVCNSRDGNALIRITGRITALNPEHNRITVQTVDGRVGEYKCFDGQWHLMCYKDRKGGV